MEMYYSDLKTIEAGADFLHNRLYRCNVPLTGQYRVYKRFIPEIGLWHNRFVWNTTIRDLKIIDPWKETMAGWSAMYHRADHYNLTNLYVLDLDAWSWKEFIKENRQQDIWVAKHDTDKELAYMGIKNSDGYFFKKAIITMHNAEYMLSEYSVLNHDITMGCD